MIPAPEQVMPPAPPRPGPGGRGEPDPRPQPEPAPVRRAEPRPGPRPEPAPRAPGPENQDQVERAQPNPVTGRTETYLYPAELNLAQKTGDSVDRALLNMNRVLLGEGEVRRMSIGRAALPFAVALGAGGAAAGRLAEALPLAGEVTAVLSPMASGVRRIMGENAFSQFARFANRREDRGIFSRIFHGAESRVLKWLFFREDRDTRQLMRLFDQNADPNQLRIGSRDRINDLITAGVMAELKAQMIAEHNIQISPKEDEKIKRMHDAYAYAKRIFQAKIPTPGQREIFVNEILPDLLRGREQRLWLQQTLGLGAVGAGKAMVTVLLGNGLIPLITDGLLPHVATGYNAVSAWLGSELAKAGGTATAFMRDAPIWVNSVLKAWGVPVPAPPVAPLPPVVAPSPMGPPAIMWPGGGP